MNLFAYIEDDKGLRTQGTERGGLNEHQVLIKCFFQPFFFNRKETVC